MLALAVDLVWGFAGILSLGHAAFFALGGYAMGMYLMRQIGARGVYGNANLPDFMVFLGWHELPWYWHGFEWFGFAALMVVLVPGRPGTGVRLAGVPLARHRRVPVDHHPGADLRAAAGVLPQRHGLRRQQRHDRLQGPARLSGAGRDHALRAAGDHRAVPLRAVPGGALAGDIALRQGAGRGARRRGAHAVPGLSAGILQAGGVGAVGGDGRDRRRALRAAGRHHQPVGVLAGQLDRGGDLGRGRRPRHAVGRDPRRGAGQSGQDLFHQRAAVAVAVRAGCDLHLRHPAAAARHRRSVRPSRARSACPTCARAVPAAREATG